ncbi:MAG TPA: UDP-N-acetylmuramoyl-L-alanyl-D-glutamate--2,6-diaminopimelate ligase [Methylomirabilota bacterium]|nr:UDP-N-acetylmuramoyl-L-alanyl-D-glutamate--2,6-diaminopimelate ligase [Methylomirabilota bacterium]
MEREMPLSELLASLPEKTVVGTPPAWVRAIRDDSRKVGPEECFVAVPGLRQDARRFVPEALRRGAALLVTEPPALPELPIAQIVVPSARVALGRIAAAYYEHPSRRLAIVGITGTNGKTTTSYLVEALLQARGWRTGVIGTVQYRVGDRLLPAGQTTPDALELQSMLAAMRDDGVGGVAMEVSSHALALARVDEVAFDIGVFTNLTQDHLDFHGTLDDYRRAKRRLFELLERSPKPARTAVVNGDDPSGPEMTRSLDLPVVTFGLRPPAAVRATEWQSSLDGLRLTATTPGGLVELRSPLIGEHNVMNVLGAVATGLALGLAPDVLAATLARVGAVPGRFEQVRAGQPFLVVVDYAHTPDALERVLGTARKLTRGRLAVVFGCGGDRDRGKRPIMGAIAACLADRVWVTSDNPRSEPPGAIIDEVVAGVSGPEAAGRLVREADRRAAIAAALGWAAAGDAVVIAGKGHENYQIVGNAVLPFDDRDVARQILQERWG